MAVDDVPLLVYVDRRFLENERAASAALEALNRATIRSDDATARRFESVNEFRSALADQQRTFINRQEYDANHHNLEGRVAALEAFRYEYNGNEKASARNMALVIAFVGLFVSAGVLVLQYLSRGH